jgi:hypothetical protein
VVQLMQETNIQLEMSLMVKEDSHKHGMDPKTSFSFQFMPIASQFGTISLLQLLSNSNFQYPGH